jgi:hypothetical protein
VDKHGDVEILLGRSASLHILRQRILAFVRALRRYFTTVRLPINVHVGLLDHVLLQPARALLRVGHRNIRRFLAHGSSLIATFGGTTTKQGVFTVTPTPSSTMSQLVLTPVGTISVFGFKTPVPYPFGLERTGYLVTDMDEAIRAAKATGADVLVAAFNDPIGRDAIIQWPGHRWRSSRRGGACRRLALSSMGGACLQHSEIADSDRAWPVFVLLLPPRLWLTVAHFRAVLLTALLP